MVFALTLRAPGAIGSGMSEETPDLSKLSFEAALHELEQVVSKLESGEVPLDDSIDLYERGEKLRQHCQARLDAAQARIEKIVTSSDGQAKSTVPFDQDS